MPTSSEPKRDYNAIVSDYNFNIFKNNLLVARGWFYNEYSSNKWCNLAVSDRFNGVNSLSQDIVIDSNRIAPLVVYTDKDILPAGTVISQYEKSIDDVVINDAEIPITGQTIKKITLKKQKVTWGGIPS